MSYGYRGNLLRVDLTARTVRTEPLNMEWAGKYVGGTGLATRYLYDQVSPATKPEEPENPLIFMTGPLCGTPSITSGRHHVVALSPLTGLYGESDCGGYWGEQLKKAGYDGIIFTGQASEPLYLWIRDEAIELRTASHLWGMDSYELEAPIKRETDARAVVACIGTAAERGALIANIMHDGSHGRAAGRCGLGAVMAGKRLKAVVVKGTGRVEVADREGLKDLVKRHAALAAERLKDMRTYGTARMIQASEQIGSMPIQNFRYPHRWEEGAARISGPAMAEKGLFIKSFFCGSCVIGCGKTVQVKEGPYRTAVGGGPEYETLNLLGANCLVDNLEAICLANELCNRYGIDTVETGSLTAFAMEAFQEGLISSIDTGGLTLKWGDADAMLELVRMIGERRGVGELLSQGYNRTIQVLGPKALDMAMQVKGLAIPAHDPRAYNGLACSYATSNRGAHHTSGQTHLYEHRLKVPEIGHEPPGRFVVDGKGKLAALTQDIMNVLDSAKSCKFAQNGGWTIGPVAQALHFSTGVSDSVADLIRKGERSFNLKRWINVQRGVTRKEDVLPTRMLTLAKTAEGYTPNLPPLETMLHEYYRSRGWSDEGTPLPETLERLEIP